MSAEIEIRPTTYAEWYALEEDRDRLRDELDLIKLGAEGEQNAKSKLYDALFPGEPDVEREVRWKWMILEVKKLQDELDRLRSAPVEVGVPWISVEDRLPEDGQSVAFVTKCDRDPYYHGRVLGGRYTAGKFGGFAVPGLMSEASHWLALPPPPVALRSQRAAEGGAR